MMFGAILGLIGSALPELIKIYKSKQDHKHELEMLEMQLKYQKEMAEMRIAEAQAMASIELDKAMYEFAKPSPVPELKHTGSKLIDIPQIIGYILTVLANVYTMTVRPTLTYLVIACWLLVKYAMWKSLGGELTQLPQIWSDIDNEFVSCVVVFWFGQRAFFRAKR